MLVLLSTQRTHVNSETRTYTSMSIPPQINWWEEAFGFPWRNAFVFPLNTTVVGQEFRSFQIKNLTPGVPYVFCKYASG